MSGFTFPTTFPITWSAPRPAGFWLGQDRDLAVKVFVSRPDGHTWTDVSSYVRYINRKRGDVSSVGAGQTGADAMSQTCTLRLICARRRTPAGEIVGDSFHPLVRTSPWNLFDVDGDGADEYAPLLWPNREIVIDVSAVPAGATPGMCDWFRMFHGYLGDGIDGDASSPEVTIECRDGMKLLMDCYIEVEREYGSEAGTPAEVVMQQIIDDNMVNGPRVYCPLSPGLMIKPYRCTYKTVADALVEIANQCGWWIGWRWIPDYNDFRLAFLAPPRGKDASCADWLLDWNENMLMQTLRISDREVRNALTLTYHDEATGTRQTITVEDWASIQAFGRRAMGIEEKDTSLINTPAEALAMATAAVHDQKDLPALTEIELPFLPTLDIFDGIVVHNPLLSSTTDFYAVHTAEDVLQVQGDRLTARTRVAAAGRVMGGLHKWRRMETRPGSRGEPISKTPKFTLIVAASDSSHEERRNADFFCDGTADEVQINAAAAALAGAGGTVQLLRGTYVVSDSIRLPDNVTLAGRGAGTVVRLADNRPSAVDVVINASGAAGNDYISLEGFVIDGNKANNVSYGSGVALTGPSKYAKIAGMWIRDCKWTGIEQGAPGEAEGWTISGCTVTGCWHGILIAGAKNTITGNVCNDNSRLGIAVGGSTARQNTIVGNTCQGNGYYGISVDGDFELSLPARDNSIQGNICQGNGADGIRLNYAQFCTVVGNLVQGNGQCGVCVYRYSKHNVVSNNEVLENSQSTDNTYDNISLDFGCDYNTIQGNTCRRGSLTNKPRYGIRINSADCEGNMITNNDLYDAGSTANFSNAGTGTVTSAGNRL